MIGGLLVGVIEQLGSGCISPKARDILIYAPLLAILLFAPGGCSAKRSWAEYELGDASGAGPGDDCRGLSIGFLVYLPFVLDREPFWAIA